MLGWLYAPSQRCYFCDALANRVAWQRNVTLYAGGLNRSTEHFILKGKDGVSRDFTATEKTELWDPWQRGESLKAIGRAFGKLIVHLFPSGTARWDWSYATAPLAVGIDALRCERCEFTQLLSVMPPTTSAAWLNSGKSRSHRGLRIKVSCLAYF